MRKKHKVIIDTDPGVDDCVAIILALFDKKIDIQLFTTVNGNLDIQKNTRNLLHLLEKFDLDYPVAVGCAKPLVRPLIDAKFIHGDQGMGFYKPKEPKRLKPIEKDAVEAMYEIICANPNEVSILGLGPHTNIASLLLRHPDAAANIKQIIFEGGSPWNEPEPYISFNRSSDPEATQIVLDANIPLVFIPSRMGRETAYLTEKEVLKIRKSNDVGEFLFEMFDRYWEPGYSDKRIAMNDSCAYLYLVKPYLFTGRRADLTISTTDAPGRTFVRFKKTGHTLVITDVKRKHVYQALLKRVKKLNQYQFYNL